MKYISPLISDARNKLGGTVFARNRAGVYTRALVAPTQPRTVSQQANRAAFASITQGWRALSQQQRATWLSGATATVLTDSLGGTYRPSGFQLYVSCNRNAQLCGLVPLTTYRGKPTGAVTVVTHELNAESAFGVWNSIFASFQISYNGSDPLVIISASPTMSPGISFVNPSVYRVLETDDGTLGDYELATLYNVVFGTGAAPDLRLSVIFRWIDPPTGFEVARMGATCISS